MFQDEVVVSDAEWFERLTAEAQLPFDLEQWPLFRVRLFRKSNSGQVLLLSAHPIIADAQSLSILMRDLTALYEQERAHATSTSKQFEADTPELCRYLQCAHAVRPLRACAVASGRSPRSSL